MAITHRKIRTDKTLNILNSQVNAYLRLYRLETCVRVIMAVSAPVKEWRIKLAMSGGRSGTGNSVQAHMKLRHSI